MQPSSKPSGETLALERRVHPHDWIWAEEQDRNYFCITTHRPEFPSRDQTILCKIHALNRIGTGWFWIQSLARFNLPTTLSINPGIAVKRPLATDFTQGWAGYLFL